jgi:UDP-2-acetamido-3-amino-2,3-dideoxy-glucuronate N-acetyltransferase
MYNYQNIYDSKIGENTKIACFVEIGGSVVGDNCKIQAFVYIPPGVVIGDNVFIGPHTCFTNVKNPPAKQCGDFVSTVVCDNAVIGANCTILPGVEIGSGAFVGAGSVVTKNVAPKTCVVGNPARELKRRKEIMDEALKNGLSEQMQIKDSEKKMGMGRDNPSQIPKKPAPEKASKGGKSFKIQ